MIGWNAMLALGGYLLVHMALCLLVRRKELRSEGGIFWAHVASFGAVGVLSAGGAFASGGEAAWAIPVACLTVHGLYSLSFLEAWSLAEGSYSLSILRAIRQGELNGQALDLEMLQELGTRKQRGRTASLERLGLVERRNGWISLTQRGLIAAVALSALRRWAHPGKEA